MCADATRPLPFAAGEFDLAFCNNLLHHLRDPVGALESIRRALRPGGTLVVSGSTSGPNPPADLQRVFFLQLNVIGSTMGTRDELQQLARLCETSGIRPQIDRVLPLGEARDGFAAMADGDVFGKIVFTP